MQLSIHDKTLKRVGFINNNLPDALHYFNDNWHRYLAEGTSTFDLSVNKVNSNYALLTLQSYISFTYDGEDYLFNIINIEQDHYSMRLQCENLNLELISEEVGAYGNTKRHSIVWYLKNAAKITDDLVEIGNNPFSLVDEDVSNPILSFDNDETKLSRIISICKSFNAEFQFKTQLKNDGTLQNITIDLYKEGGVGQKRKDVTLYYGKNIAGITSKADRTSTFFNATTVTDSKNKFNWISVEGKSYNSYGQLEFYKNAGDNTAYAPLSRDMFPSQLKSASSDRYTRKNLSIEATSANSLWDYAVSQFKLYAYPQMTYEVSVAVNAVTSALGNGHKLDIGDTIIVQDDTFDKSEGGLILSARVSEQELSFTNPKSNKIIFTNFVKLKSDISADLYGRMKNLVDQNTPYRFEIVSDNGLTFKNSTGSTTLTALVYKGSNVEEVSADSFEWLIDGVKFGGTAKSQLVSSSQVTGTAVVRYNAKLGNTVIGGIEVTIQDISDGISPTVTVNPDTSLTIVDAQGTSTTPVLKGTDGIAGKDGVGVKSTVITYATSTSGTTAPSTGWTSSVPSLVKGQYLWTKTVWSYTDNSSETGYSVSYISKDGNNGTDGIAGKDGVGISNTIIEYVGAVSGTSKPTSGWGTTIPTVPAGQYLWTRTTWQYTDGTSEQGFTNALMGKTGATGPKGVQGVQGLQGPTGTQGIAGLKGADGKTQYTHIAYANSSDGVTNFSTSDSNRTYIGMYIDFNIDDSTTPSDYSWTLVKGADGTQGISGKPGADGKTPYFHTAWSYSADGTDSFTTVYQNLNLGDNTKTFVGAEVGGSNLRGSIVIDPATQKTQDGDFYYLTVKAPRDNYDWFRFFLIPELFTPNMTKVAVKPNTAYTFSVLLKGTGQHTIYAYNSWADPNTPWVLQINLTSDWKLYTFTVTSSNVIPDRNVQFFIRSNNGTEISLKYPKVEEGSIATPYMQSASEVTTADWPKYIGHYTDFTQADSTNPSAYTWSLMRGNDGKDGVDGIAGKDGKGIKATAITYQASTNGTTAPTGTWSANVPAVAKGSFLWTRTIWTYTDNTTETGYAVAYMGTNGNNGTNGVAGKDGVGIKATTITYVGSTNGTTAPTSGWTSAVPTVAAGSYLWTKTVWAYTDNTSETGYSVAMMGLKGDKGDQGTQGVKGSDGTSGIIVSSVAPTSPLNGQLWQDTSTTPQLVKKWIGNEWVIWELYAQNLKADKLETLSAKIGKIYNEFDNSSGGIDNKGTITIKDSVKVVYYLGNSSTTIDLVTSSSGQGLFTQHLPDKNDASKFKQSWYMPTGLYFSDSINKWNGQITAENVTLVPWTNLILKSGYTAGDGTQPQYRRIKNLDGSYTVQFRGAISPTSGNFSTTQVQVANIPEVYRPSSTAMRQGSVGTSNSTVSSARLSMTASGNIFVFATSNTTYVYLDALTYVN